MSNAISNHLPPAARDLLVKAANYPVPRRLNALDEYDEHMRKQAIEHAIQRVKTEYPQFFKKEQ
jgi:hypothetical protein